MKEISEEMQMQIFDLLEGNLSPSKAKAVLAEIELSSVLKEEYSLMKMTYLPKEENVIVLPPSFKQSLYKKAVLLPMAFFAKAAAIVCLLGVGSYYFYTSNSSITPKKEGKAELKVAQLEPRSNKIVEPLNPVRIKENLINKKVNREALTKNTFNRKDNGKAHYITVKAAEPINSSFSNLSDGSMAIVTPLRTIDTFSPKASLEEPMQKAVVINVRSNKRSWKPVEVIMLDEPMQNSQTNATANTRASFASRMLKSTKENFKRGQTPDIDIKFNRKKMKFKFDFISH